MHMNMTFVTTFLQAPTVFYNRERHECAFWWNVMYYSVVMVFENKQAKYFPFLPILLRAAYSLFDHCHPGHELFIYPQILWNTRCIKMSQPGIQARPVIIATFSGNQNPGNYDKCNKVWIFHSVESGRRMLLPVFPLEKNNSGIVNKKMSILS